MTLPEFLNRYPEFEDPDDTSLASACLAEAAAEIDSTVYGARFDEAHGALTAHKLWTSAFGVTLRQDGSGAPGESKYLQQYKAVQKAVTVPLTMMVT